MPIPCPTLVPTNISIYLMKNSIAFCILLCCGFFLNAQKSDTLRFMFYNVENLFDTYDDTLTNDNEFLPSAEKHWTINRFYSKLNNIYKTVASSGWEPPHVIGFAEVENTFCLEQLLLKTPLVNKNYEIVHFNSPDVRGIDVGLLYDSKKAELIEAKALPVDISNYNGAKTRDILYVKLRIEKRSNYHIFVNHWPSRRNGVTASEPKRMQASATLARAIDSILKINANARIVVMGDFNDNPENKSIQELCRGRLINMNSCNSIGTLKYKGRWHCYDQMMISNTVHNNNSAYFSIIEHSFLLEEDKGNVGWKPKRTYQGPIYKGGFSDHLPIMLKITNWQD